MDFFSNLIRQVACAIGLSMAVALGAGSYARAAESALPATEGRQQLAASANDTRISASVKARLMADAMTEALPIEVETEAQVVVLSGEAETYEQIKQAISLAERVQGVKRVESRLRIDNQVDQPRRFQR